MRCTSAPCSAYGRIRYHEIFRHDPHRVDHHFHHEDLMEVAKLVPDEWVYETSLTGPIEDCVKNVKKMQAYKDTGIHEICFLRQYPTENASRISAWQAARC